MEYEMTQAQFDKMIEHITSARNTPLIMLQCGAPPSVQEVANGCWQELGREMGFDGMTVKPHPSGNQLKFTATPTPQFTKEATP